MKKMLLILLAWPILSNAQNLLKNPSFEDIDPNAGGVARHPAYWTVTDVANRCNWRAHDEGKFCIGICGLWADIGVNGSVYQEDIPILVGLEYVLIPWLYADHDWMPRKQYMRVEYYGDDKSQILDKAEIIFRDTFPFFSNKNRLCSIAPEGAKYARVTIGVRGVALRGGLTIDDVFFGLSDETNCMHSVEGKN